MNNDINHERAPLETFDALITRCREELDELSEILTDVRRRQKAQFGQLLIRTTLNKPFKDLLKECEELDGS